MGIRKSEVKMNGYVIVLLVAAATYSASGFAFFHPAGQQDAEHCTEDEGIRAINWDTTCSRFFQCVDGLWTVRSCKTGTVIDLTTGRCTHPDNTVEWIRPECRDKAREDKLEEEAALLRQEQERFPFGSLTGEGSDPDASNTAPYVGLNPYSCIGHNPHVPIAHRDCSKYRQCVSGFWQTRECNPGTVFDVSKLRCAHRHLAWGCGIQAENSYKKQLEESTFLRPTSSCQSSKSKRTFPCCLRLISSTLFLVPSFHRWWFLRSSPLKLPSQSSTSQ